MISEVPTVFLSHVCLLQYSSSPWSVEEILSALAFRVSRSVFWCGGWLAARRGELGSSREHRSEPYTQDFCVPTYKASGPISLPNFCGFFLAFMFCTLKDSKHALKDAIAGETLRREKARVERVAILILKV